MAPDKSFAALAALLSIVAACADRFDHPADDPAERASAVAPARSRVLKLRVLEGETQRTFPVVLTAAADQSWSSAFRLVCSECGYALSAFGYTPDAVAFAASYDSEAALRADNRIDDALPIVDLPIEASDPPAILAAYRVVDAKHDEPTPYLVRLRAAPDRLYATTCANFLEVAQGSRATLPVSSAVLEHWQLAPPYPQIGCSSLDAKALPPPAPAETVRSTSDAASIVSVWSVSRALPGVRTAPYPYLVTRDATGGLRGFALDCGSEALGALAAFGLGSADLRPTPPSDDELDATHFGAQPVLRCGGIGGARITALASPNDAARVTRFQFDAQRDLIAFSCEDAERFFQAQAPRALEVPYQALARWSDFDGLSDPTRIFTLGCRFDVRSVRDFLARIRGRQIVTGQHNREPNAEPGRSSAQVRAITGVSPGLWSGDFLFAASDVRDRPTLVAHALEEWKSGALVRLAFHACAPNAPSFCSFAQGDGIRRKLNDAEWSALLTDGTQLNLAWKARLDEVVPHLRRLADAGVSVIWSPLHFANDGWGWWQGRPGPEGSRALYRLTHRHLHDDQRLRNLIWEWNAKDLGDPRTLASYYPGDDVVDVVALSPWQGGFPTADFYQTIRTLAGDKPIALGEITKLPTASQLAAQPDWVYFSVWAEGLTEQNTVDEIRTAYQQPRALRRGEIPLPGFRTAPPRTTPTAPAAPDPASADGVTAAARFGWGAPLPESDEFDVPGPPNPRKWGLPTGPDDCMPGHLENGRRCAKNATVVDGLLRLTGEVGGDTGWVSSKLHRRYGRIEARVRSQNTGPKNDRQYHPVLLVWPSSDVWPRDGEYDFLENSVPGDRCAKAFMHYPHPRKPVEQESATAKNCDAPLSAWHNVAFEWTATHVAGFVDGIEFYRFAGGAGKNGRSAIQDMPSGSMKIQLDNFYGAGLTPAVQELDWVRFYAP